MHTDTCMLYQKPSNEKTVWYPSFPDDCHLHTYTAQWKEGHAAGWGTPPPQRLSFSHLHSAVEGSIRYGLGNAFATKTVTLTLA